MRIFECDHCNIQIPMERMLEFSKPATWHKIEINGKFYDFCSITCLRLEMAKIENDNK